MKKKLVIEKKEPLATFSYKMDAVKKEEAEKLCRKTYNVGLSSIIRKLVEDHFKIK